MSARAADRYATALRRVREAIESQSELMLSNVFFDSKEDGEDEIDYEANPPRVIGQFDYGFDCDDLAAVLLPLLTGALERQS